MAGHALSPVCTREEKAITTTWALRKTVTMVTQLFLSIKETKTVTMVMLFQINI